MFRWRSFLSLALGLVLGGLCIGSVQAAPLEDVSVTLTRQTVATSTDVAVAFTTPGGVNVPADAIHIQFASGFDLTTIDFSDLSLTYGPVTGLENSVTLAAASGMGIWSAEVDPLLENTVVLRPPMDTVMGTVPASDRMVLKIGLWAGGADTVTTPATTGVYRVYVGGPFGDSGNSYVLISDTSGLNVSATVPAAGGGGGGAAGGGGGGSAPDLGPPAYDGTGPVISALRAEAITTSSAMIRWTTDEPADASLEYGVSAGSYTLGSRTRADRRTSHEFLLESLSPDTNYHVRVSAKDASGNTSISSNFSFRTISSLLVSELTISDIEILYVDDQKAVIRWNTSVDTYGEIRYGSGASLGSVPDTVLARSHTVTLLGLTPATFYPFQVVATTPTGERLAVDGSGFLTANDVTPPSNVLNFRGTYTTASGIVELRWTNPPDADLKYVIITRYTDASAVGELFVCDTLGEQCADTPPAGVGTLVYRAVAQDIFGNRSSGAITSVVIPASSVVPEPEPEAEEELNSAREDGTARPTPRPVVGGPDVEFEVVLPPILRPLSPGTGTTESAIESGGGMATTTVGAGIEPGASTSTGALTPPLLPEGVESTFELAPEFFLSSTVPATPDRSGVRSALAGRAVQIRLPIAGATVSLREAQILASDGSIYQFAYREAQGAYVSDFTFDAAQGETQFVQIQAIATDGQAWTGRFPFRIQSLARVVDISEQARAVPVSAAIIEVLLPESGATIARIQTDERGRYAEILPNGRYRIRVLQQGFRAYEKEVFVETGILAQDIQLRRTIRSWSELIDPNASLLENLNSIGSEIAFVAQIGLETVRSPEVQQVTQTVVAPAVVVATVGTTTAAVTGFNLLNYLRFLFTQPLLLIRRRKRQSWGVVYNALSKQPIELAIVRLMKAGTTFALQTRITDAQGRFSFFVPAGSYTIQIQKPGYQFPTTYLKDERMDVDFTDLYHGEEIKVTGPVTISPNIPVDPRVKEETPKAILRKRYWRKAQSLLGMGGIFVGFAAVVISPTVFMAGFALLQVASYALFRRLAVPPAPKRWGIVYDAEGKKPLEKTVVRVFDKKFNKLLETQITSKDGTYGFFAAKGHYYLTAEKPGYERYLSADLDLTKAADTYIDHRFELKRAGAVAK
jgi:hypothetical protein